MKKHKKIIIVIIVIVILCLFFFYKKESQKNNKINEVFNPVKIAKTDIKLIVKPKVRDSSIEAIKLPEEVQNLEKDKIINNILPKPTRLEYKSPTVNKINTTNSKKQNIKTYHTPYFSINYSSEEWNYAEGKDMDIPSYIKIPRHAPIAMVELMNEKDNNLIFIYVSTSSKMNFNNMNQQRITEYIQYLYNDTRNIDLKFETINGLKFATYQFVPANNSSILVKQFLTTKNGILYSIAFVETHANPIDEGFIKNKITFK